MAVYLGDKKVEFFGGRPVNISTEGLDTSDATATANDIRTNRTAYVNGEKVIGTLTESNLVSLPGDNVSFIKGSSSGSGSTPNKISISSTSGDETILKSNSSIGVNIEATNFGDATASDVLSGKTFTSVNGLKIEGTHVCSEGLDTSDATATASDIATGKTAYVDGELITGNIALYSGITMTYDSLTENSDNTVTVKGTRTSKVILTANGYSSTKVPLSEFGDASPEHVAAGVTFTSANGLKVEGTASLQMYTWKKYNVIDQTQTDAYRLQESPNFSLTFTNYSSTNTLYKTMTFDTSTGAFTLGGESVGSLNGAGILNNYTEYPYYYYDDETKVLKIDSVTTSSNLTSTTYTATGTLYYSIQNEPYAKGTYVEDVQSISISAYPSDGYQDGYWYVLQSNSGLTTKTGTTTSTTIDTGLSEIEQFYIYKDSISATGLIHLTYNSSGTSYLYASAWSTSTWGTKTITSGTTAATVSGGTITLPSSTATTGGLSESTTYNWVATGKE